MLSVDSDDAAVCMHPSVKTTTQMCDGLLSAFWLLV